MPELPEVESARRLALSALGGMRLQEVLWVKDPIIFEGQALNGFSRALKGATCLGAERWGKHFWLVLDRKPWPVFHLGMTGSFSVYQDQEHRPPYWKLEIRTARGDYVAMVNKRRLGRVRLRKDPRNEPPIDQLGFDPLLEKPPASFWQETLGRRKTTIKAALLDQSFAAGIGNWIADEVLFQSEVAPSRRCDRIEEKEWKVLRRVLHRVIGKAVEVDADSSQFPKSWLFHRRWGKKHTQAPDGSSLCFETIGGRTTAWVPSRQR